MSKLTEDLDKLIRQAALDGSLTKDAVDMFHGVLKENDDIKKDLEKQNKDLSNMQKERDALSASFAQISTKLSDYQTRERELEEREQENLKLQLEAKHQGERVEDHKEMVKLVFRNLEVRRSVFPVQPSQNINDQGITAPGGYIEEREQTEKTE